MLMFCLGLSVALNICLISFLIFIFSSNKLENLLEDRFERKVKNIKESKDPFINL